MSAEVLRRAAALMRLRAEAVPIPDGSESIGASSFHDGCLSLLPEGDREHAAALGPAVALAVADWLDAEATALEHRLAVCVGRPLFSWDRALAVARAYLGEPA